MTWSYYINNNGNGRNYQFKNVKIYLAYRDWVGENIYYNDFNKSFTGQFLSSGFDVYKMGITNIPSIGIEKYSNFNPINNWFGVSKYTPDVMFVKDDKTITMSLNGLATPYNEKYKELFETCSIKYIKVKQGDKILYEDWTGNLPSKELINSIL